MRFVVRFLVHSAKFKQLEKVACEPVKTHG